MAVYKKARYQAPTQPPWSKMQRAVSLIVAPGLPLQIQCRVYPMHAQYGTTGIPRYWITLDREIIWDYPRQFVGRGSPSGETPDGWPYVTDISEISRLIRDYLETPRSRLLTESFPRDVWGIVDILRAADRRVGRRQWGGLEARAGSVAVTKVLARRRARRVAPE